MRQREPAICISAIDYSETSQVVHFLTRGAGTVRLLAKGSKRSKSKSGGAIDLFSEGELLFIPSRAEGLGTLVEFAESVAHNALRKDAAALDAGLFMIEAAGRMLAAGDPHPEVFDLLHNSIKRLAEADAPRGAVLAYFLWRLVRHVGLLGELRVCVSCGREVDVVAGHATCLPGEASAKSGCTRNVGRALPVDSSSRDGQAGGARPTSTAVAFSSSLGGLLCGECVGAVSEMYRLDGAALAGLAAMAEAEAGARPAGRRAALPPEQAQAVIRVLAYHIGQQTGRPLRMAGRSKGAGNRA